MIPILHGMDATRAHITRQRALADKAVPPHISARLEKLFGREVTPEAAVAQILADVRARGDAAVQSWTEKIDGVAPASFWVTADEIETAYSETPTASRDALQLAAERIRTFHRAQFARLDRPDPHAPPHTWLIRDGDTALGQMLLPIKRVGIYVPGGSAPLPSSLLMSVIPAQVAGVSEIIIASPPSRDGFITPVILAAARVAGVSRVLALGGAQAIGALAYGTATIPRMDKIVGAGGLFTTLAKRQVFGAVGIEGLSGPTETLLIADDSANPRYVAADLLAQAEHDALATALLLTDSATLASAVRIELEHQLPELSRREIIAASFAAQGAICVLASVDECLELANIYAPEHLCLLTRDPWQIVPRIRSAGGIFVGETSSEALGDYILGPSHLMPTGATARFSSPLNVNDFLKITSIFAAGAQTSAQLAGPAQVLAHAEELTAHANALLVRSEHDPNAKSH